MVENEWALNAGRAAGGGTEKWENFKWFYLIGKYLLNKFKFQNDFSQQLNFHQSIWKIIVVFRFLNQQYMSDNLQNSHLSAPPTPTSDTEQQIHFTSIPLGLCLEARWKMNIKWKHERKKTEKSIVASLSNTLSHATIMFYDAFLCKLVFCAVKV